MPPESLKNLFNWHQTRFNANYTLTFLVEITSLNGQCCIVSWVFGSRKSTPRLFNASISSLHIGLTSSAGDSSDQTRFTAKKLLPNNGHDDKTFKNCALTCMGLSPAIDGQADCTNATHCAGRSSRSDRAGFGNRNFISFIAGRWLRSAALCSIAAILAISRT